MIQQTIPIKTCAHVTIPEDKGFFISSSSYSGCYLELAEYASHNPDKWIYYTDMGMGPGRPIPVATHAFEVRIYDAEPAAMVMMRLFQSGCEGKREIDSMSEEEKQELHKKQLAFFHMLGSIRGDIR